MDTAVRTRSNRDPVEAQLRRELAACFRLIAHFGWDDLIANHFSVRIPGEKDAFLINPFGLLFEEVTASSLIKIDTDGNLLEPAEYMVNPAGFVIHSAIHMARPEVRCVMHLHTKDGVAVSSTEDGILPLNQTAMSIGQDLAFHDYEGVATDTDERARLQNDLGNRNFMLLRNHGTLTVGESIGAAFYRLYAIEWCCTTQQRTLSMNTQLHHASEAVRAKSAQQMNPMFYEHFYSGLSWPALLRKAERLFPDFAD